MKTFLIIYIGSVRRGETKVSVPDPITADNALADWGAWITNNALQVVDRGTLLGKTMRASAAGIENIENLITAYTMVQAASHEEAARLFTDHPHLSMFPGGSIEIIECLQAPH